MNRVRASLILAAAAALLLTGCAAAEPGPFDEYSKADARELGATTRSGVLDYLDPSAATAGDLYMDGFTKCETADGTAGAVLVQAQIVNLAAGSTASLVTARLQNVMTDSLPADYVMATPTGFTVMSYGGENTVQVMKSAPTETEAIGTVSAQYFGPCIPGLEVDGAE